MTAAPRSDTVNPLEQGVYHCYSRCVRRAMLCGVDPVTKKDDSYRRDWIVDFMKQLAQLFAIDMAFHAETANHLQSAPPVLLRFASLPSRVARLASLLHGA